MSRVLPAEWAPQSGVQLTWPHGRSDWSYLLDDADAVFASIGAAVTRFERLLVVCQDEAHRSHVLQRLEAAGADLARVITALAPANDTWARDHGPITVLEDGRLKLLDFTFNGWGGKYAADEDNRITARLKALGIFDDLPVEPVDLVLEGGSIESDGQGTLLTTAGCLLTPTRNPHLDRAGIEQVLKQSLGVRRVLWLEHGDLEGDDTDGHVDTLARLCTPDTIAYVTCNDRDDPHHGPLKAMEAELKALRTADGEPYRLVALPLPAPIQDEDGRRLPATHANFLIINGAVLVPTYDDPTDAIALERLGEVFPDREIIGIDCRTLIHQYGSLHCVTMQLPEGVLV
ncbi:agmatine deiminase family protein [Thioalkalivibrio sulfidiphilus]|uniref:Agmatine deiminase n=1 Tax=Thioalkalivibrio sulfidiphilus (strain HL-EbGR7) TaxID=396588 RepID=B8GR27_THISH|nr:agmatine deiminase family protein [Thioalkalivibrio sulfidiphilus]ACL72447.1 Agmatine deiminase [Thioalkalivibrio sulfidiphilus HL-EbGr7]